MNATAKGKWMLAAMFSAGVVTGVALAAGAMWHFIPPMMGPKGSEVVKFLQKDMRKDLSLNAEQEARISPILERHGVAIDRIRQETLLKVLASIEVKNAEVMNELLPQQQAIFEQREAERHRKFRTMMDGTSAP